jgi:protein disulfide-isomerase A1
VSELKADQVKSFAESDKVVIVGLFKSKKDNEYKTFENVANKWRDSLIFGYTNSEDSLASYNVTAPAILMFKKFDEKLNVFSGEFTELVLNEFIQDHSMPHMDEIGPDNFEAYMKKGLPILYLFVSTDEERAEAGAEVETLAKEYKGKLSFVYLDACKLFYLFLEKKFLF